MLFLAGGWAGNKPQRHDGHEKIIRKLRAYLRSSASIRGLNLLRFQIQMLRLRDAFADAAFDDVDFFGQ